MSIKVLLSLHKNFPAAQTQKSMTINVSHGGCFVYSLTEWLPGSNGWSQIRGIADPTPIEAVVRWQQAWGGKHRVPGIGLEFTQITAVQRDDFSVVIQQNLD